MIWKPDICIYHAACDDGFGAAWAVWKRWGDVVTFIPASYGQSLPVDDMACANVLFVDFSAKRAEIETIAAVAKSIVIIDHHKTAQAELEPFKAILPSEASLCPGNLGTVFNETSELGISSVVAWFDMAQSGAAMAWKFAFPNHHVPQFLRYIEDRDLWRFQFGDETRRFSAALRTYPMDFKTWDSFMLRPDRLTDEGVAILRSDRMNVQKFLHEAYFDAIDGHNIPMVNVPYIFASDTAHALLQKFPDAPFAACWSRLKNGRDQYSLRSDDSRLDVSVIAAKFGGGGHRNAAGFLM